jgi:hypothetical protein
MEKNKIMTGLIMLIFSVSIVHASSCDKSDTEESVLYGTQAEDVGHWATAAGHYRIAATCYEGDHDWDNAIKYQRKAIEMEKKANMSYGLGYKMVSGYYSKKGSGFEKEIRENCDLAEEAMLREINEPGYVGAALDYHSLADCFDLVNDTEKACKYCTKANEDSVTYGSGSWNCASYGCPKSSNPTPSDTGSSSGIDSSFPVIPVVGGLIALVLIVVAFFLLKGRKRKDK